MNNGSVLHKLVEHRHQELLHEAETYWRTRQVSVSQQSRRPISVIVRARLGHMLIAWGKALQPRVAISETQQVIVQ